MIYNGYFKDIKDSSYTVRITTKKGNVAKEITLSDNPFTTEMDESDSIIYDPVKYQTATVEAISGDYMMDIYSGTALNTKVELLKESEVVWTGYATPCLYDMGFALPRESIQIECQDGLSTLQYFPYRQDDKQVRSFFYIVQKVLTKCNCYKTFYVANNTGVERISNGILQELYISEQNFFDDKEDNETDDDVAWKCNEVLEEICRYLGLTAFADKESVYFVDYDLMKAHPQWNCYYIKYTVGDFEDKGEQVSVNFYKEITKEDYASDDSTISLDSVYNKVTIKADLHDYEDAIPDMYETADNITADSDNTLKASDNINNGMYGEVVKSMLGEKSNNNMIIMIDRIYNPLKKSYGAHNVVAVKYFNSPYYKFFKYNGTKDVTDSTTSINYTDTKSMHGASIAKFFVKKIDVPYDNIFEAIFNIVNNKQYTLDDWMSKNQLSDISFSDYIMLLNPEDNHISNEDIQKYPYVQTTVSNANTALFGGENAYLIITGNYCYHYFDDDPYPIPSGEADIAEGRYAMDAGLTSLLAKLQWGKYYWNGSRWGTQNVNFEIPYLLDTASDGERRADATMFKNNDFVNTVSWRIGTTEKGYAIKVPDKFVMSGLPILTLFKPYDPNYHSTKSGKNKGQHYHHCCVFLKDFEIKAIIGDPTFSDKNETDTEYSLDIDTDYVNELDDINFKINTWDNKKPNYSCVAYKDKLLSNGDFLFVDKTWNFALKNEVNGMTFSSDDGDVVSEGSLRQEWWLIYRIYKLYKDASVILNLTLRNDNEQYGVYKINQFPDKLFIVDSINRDYKNNTQEIKLIEKK